MDYKSLNAPNLSIAEIRKKAEEFRDQFGRNIPFDIQGVLEFDLNIKIIPTVDLFYRANTSALISSQWDYLYVDKVQFEDPRHDRRTNFSIAHEVGHFVLHKQLYIELGIKDVETFYRFFTDCPNEVYNRIESQASLFASFLMVPTLELESKLKELLELVKIHQIEMYDVIVQLESYFAVSREVILKRIYREKLISEVPDEFLDRFA